MNRMNLDWLEDYPWTYDRSDSRPTWSLSSSSHKSPDSFEMGGLRFVCPAGIYHPTESSSMRFMYRGVFNELPRMGRRVLDVGTGCGAMGICWRRRRRRHPAGHRSGRRRMRRQQRRINRVKCGCGNRTCSPRWPAKSSILILFNIPLMDKAVESPIDLIACDPAAELFTRFMQRPRATWTPAARCVSASPTSAGGRRSSKRWPATSTAS